MSMFHEAKNIILGNTAGPAEIRWTRGADPRKVAKLRVCTEYGGGPNRESHKEWHTVILFGRLADQAEKFVTRSMMVYVEGRPQTRRWKNDQGQDVSVMEVIANTFRPVGYQKGDAKAATHSQSGGQPQHQQNGYPQGGGYGSQQGAPQANAQPNGANAQRAPVQGQANAPAPGNFAGGQQPAASNGFAELDEEIPF